ncbi:DNA polymerase beta superfamily protein [Cellulophaga sp. E6(2014)]|uniref:nucleotidyltransferase domain-containing protein n=1 Tax=Cellulophaga sp. E6(2014) TaxID=1495334 RepID=UPI00051DE8D6|nr:nucleotidyltransferase domain-containing protein [Cellulophaga sp. E6(2014)]KGK31205.1 nucleotidyltransferase [Cellulophaga sp. E6(2014)]
MKTIEELKASGNIIFECISGSRAYGLATASSDTDIRGVFVLPKEKYYSLEYVGQINNETNDIVYYELKKFIELLSKNNPNILELLSVPEDCILSKHSLFDKVKSEYFLSKLCKDTFANYAFTQIKKARGLKKKIVNPVEKERKSVTDFCFVRKEKRAVPLNTFLESEGFEVAYCGLAKISHMKDCYNLFYNPSMKYSGVARENANEVCLSSIPKSEVPAAILYFNRDGYSSNCKRYKEYWSWVEKRNDERYKSNISHEKNYDAKNMMHTFRLLHMAREIGEHGKINVRRPDRVFLLAVKNAEFEYEELVAKAEKLRGELEIIFEKSSLMDRPDLNRVNEILIEIRAQFYE